jgi:predicted AlkP superfamily phosphohydrolase/phosphomutase
MLGGRSAGTAKLLLDQPVSAKILMVVLDAAEPVLVERWADDGSLPTFARIEATAARFDLETTIDLLPGAIWPEISTGRRPATLGWYWHPWQIQAGEARFRGIREEDFDLTAFWHVASAAGRKIAVADVPLVLSSPGINGVHVREWGTHEKHFGTASDPPGLVEELRRRYGDHPIPHDPGSHSGCDDHDGTHESLERLRTGLLAGIETKTRVFADLLARDEWDLFVACFCEAHCAGHQLWHLHDSASPWHEPGAPASLKHGLHDVYRRIDAGVGELVEAAGRDTTCVVLLTHGMGPNVGGSQVLPEVLVRLGYGSGAGAAARVRDRLPAPVKRLARTLIRGGARRRLQETAGSLPHPLESSATRAVATYNGANGAIRLNVKGRDPFGAVAPGPEYDAACRELAAAIEELENADTGTPAAEAVLRADEAFDGEVHPNIPDLLVRWRRDQPQLEAVRSPRVGTVRAPVRPPGLPRTGDHTANSRLWAVGPRVAARRKGRGRAIDIAPTMLALLDVGVPEEVDGKPLPLA